MNDGGPWIDVEVACAFPDWQEIIRLRVPPGTTVAAAIDRSGLAERYPELAVDDAHVGIFGKACKLVTPVVAGDRVEIYRDLVADPKEVRRRRAEGST